MFTRTHRHFHTCIPINQEEQGAFTTDIVGDLLGRADSQTSEDNTPLDDQAGMTGDLAEALPLEEVKVRHRSNLNYCCSPCADRSPGSWGSTTWRVVARCFSRESLGMRLRGGGGSEFHPGFELESLIARFTD